MDTEWEGSKGHRAADRSEWASSSWVVRYPTPPLMDSRKICWKVGCVALRKETERFSGENVHILTFEGPSVISQVLPSYRETLRLRASSYLFNS